MLRILRHLFSHDAQGGTELELLEANRHVAHPVGHSEVASLHVLWIGSR